MASSALVALCSPARLRSSKPEALQAAATGLQTARGEGQQQEEEWLAYAQLLANLSTAGVPRERVWDVPGGTGGEAKVSSRFRRGRPKRTAQKVLAGVATWDEAAQRPAARVRRPLRLAGNHDSFNMPLRNGPNDYFAQHAAEGQRRSSPHQRVFLHRLPGPGEAQAGDGCPAAWMVGIDPTPEPGLRSPTNFAGGAAVGEGLCACVYA